jgi:hypothetical protein
VEEVADALPGDAGGPADFFHGVSGLVGGVDGGPVRLVGFGAPVGGPGDSCE